VQATATPSYFRAPLGDDNDFERAGDFLKFPSDISTDIEENNLVWSKITDSGSRDKALRNLFIIGMHDPATDR
jgi:hypothetical protein